MRELEESSWAPREPVCEKQVVKVLKRLATTNKVERPFEGGMTRTFRCISEMEFIKENILPLLNQPGDPPEQPWVRSKTKIVLEFLRCTGVINKLNMAEPEQDISEILQRIDTESPRPMYIF